MGGAVGHLAHLYDNRDLTFNEIADILTSAASGKLEKVSEKLDGLNLVFSWDISGGGPRAARNGGEIKSGGMDAPQLADKFKGRGNLTKAFNSAFKVLKGALGALPDEEKLKVFGPSANRWYSMEIIYTENPNVINYDSNNIVFHGWPVFNVSEDGDVKMVSDDEGGVDILTSYIDKMQKAVKVRGWEVRGPALARMEKLSDDSILDSTLKNIDNELSSIGLDSTSTVRDYVKAKITHDVEDLNLSPQIKDMGVLRCLAESGAPTLRDIKKKVDKSTYETINEFIQSSPGRLKAYIRPIELAINNFAVELLKGLKSTLIADNDEEVRRLRGEVENAITAITAAGKAGNEQAMSVLKTQMEKLKSIENITSPVEGVVFIYKGNAYKFTGSFAAANQILGLFKYSRVKIKSSKG